MARTKNNKSDKVQERIRKNKAKMLVCLEEKLGVVTEAAKLAEISRDTHYRWMNEDVEYSNKVKELSEVAIDFVEEQLFKNVKGGDSSLIKFYLTTKARHRGYILKEDRNHQHQIDIGPSMEKIEWRITSPSRVNGNGKSKHSNGHISK